MNLCRNFEEVTLACRMGLPYRLRELAMSGEPNLTHFAESALANVHSCVAWCVANEPLVKSHHHGDAEPIIKQLELFYDGVQAWFQRHAMRTAIATWAVKYGIREPEELSASGPLASRSATGRYATPSR